MRLHFMSQCHSDPAEVGKREGVFASLRVVGIEPGSAHVVKDCSGGTAQNEAEQ